MLRGVLCALAAHTGGARAAAARTLLCPGRPSTRRRRHAATARAHGAVRPPLRRARVARAWHCSMAAAHVSALRAVRSPERGARGARAQALQRRVAPARSVPVRELMQQPGRQPCGAGPGARCVAARVAAAPSGGGAAPHGAGTRGAAAYCWRPSLLEAFNYAVASHSRSAVAHTGPAVPHGHCAASAAP